MCLINDEKVFDEKGFGVFKVFDEKGFQSVLMFSKCLMKKVFEMC